MTTELAPTRDPALDEALPRLRARLRHLRSLALGEIAGQDELLAAAAEDRGEDLTISQHPADVASDLTSRELLVSESRAHRAELARIEDALARIDDGTYGTCVDCGRAIPLERLDVVPEASRCVPCKRALERARP